MAWVGELFPVLAIAILLSTRARWEAVLIVLLFFAIAAVLAFVPARARKMGAGIYRAIESLRETNAQTMVRFTMVLLLALVALSAIFDLDVVLGAFVAGVVLHYIIPEGDHALEHKIESMGSACSSRSSSWCRGRASTWPPSPVTRCCFWAPSPRSLWRAACRCSSRRS